MDYLIFYKNIGIVVECHTGDLAQLARASRWHREGGGSSPPLST